MDVAERFAANLAELRKAAGISQEELAFRAGIHRTQVSFIESGKRTPRLDTLVKLAGALDVPIADLVDGLHWEPTITRAGGFKVDPK
jgi:transcriptional regulator with XRE-family HTH domain